MKKKILITVFSIIGLIVLAIGGYAIYLYSAVKDTASKMHEQVRYNSPQPKPNLKTNNHRISILLMGVDQRNGFSGSSDNS